MNLILLTGPPAVGKMTVGQELSKQLGYPLFHNHHSIELTLELFSWGTPEFKAINSGIRELVFDTVAKSKNMEGFIFTIVVAYDLLIDVEEIKKVFDTFSVHGWQPHLVDLYAPLEIRLARNPTANRLEHKPSKRNLEFSDENLLKMEQKYQMSAEDNPFPNAYYLKIDNSSLSPVEVAEQIIAEFSLKKA